MKTEHKITILSAILGLFFWVVDAVLDYFFFYEGTFLEILITDVPIHELYIRSVVLFLFIIFGMIISRLSAEYEPVGEVLRQQSPLYLLLIVTGSIFVAELLVMFLLSLLPHISLLHEALMDSLILIMFVFPILHFFVFRPLTSYIFERKKAEEERERLNRELMDKNIELEQVIYATSHDLRSPLVNIQGFSKEVDLSFNELRQVLDSNDVSPEIKKKLSPYLDDEIPEALKFIQSGVSKMDVLISGLLRLSRLGRVTLNFKQLDMNQLISDVVDVFEFQVKEKGVTIKVDELPPCVGDETQINQVFSNIVDNALKWLDPDRKGVITISGIEEKRYAVYCVEDNGIGIAAEHQDKIFDIFHRLDPRDVTGEGLGLTFARKIIGRQNGRIWVESEKGKGSKFFVSIPNYQRKPRKGV